MDAKIFLESMCSHLVVAVVFDQFVSVCVLSVHVVFR